jgi:hypothetical protein
MNIAAFLKISFYIIEYRRRRFDCNIKHYISLFDEASCCTLYNKYDLRPWLKGSSATKDLFGQNVPKDILGRNVPKFRSFRAFYLEFSRKSQEVIKDASCNFAGSCN